MLVLGLRHSQTIEIMTPEGNRLVLGLLPNLGKGVQIGMDFPRDYKV